MRGSMAAGLRCSMGTGCLRGPRSPTGGLAPRAGAAPGGRGAEYEGLLATTAPVPPEPVLEHDDAILLYTGGTTGRSKGVRLSHRNILSNAWQIGLVSGIRATDVD